MNTRILTAFVLSLALTPIASAAYAQAACPNQRCPSDPAPTLPTAQICFYSGEAQTGTFFCESGQRSVAAVPAQWRSRIKSLGIGDHSSVRVCSKQTLGGTCEQYDKNIDTLPKGLLNHVYSYDIRQAY